jgi:hypothetical protein
MHHSNLCSLGMRLCAIQPRLDGRDFLFLSSQAQIIRMFHVSRRRAETISDSYATESVHRVLLISGSASWDLFHRWSLTRHCPLIIDIRRETVSDISLCSYVRGAGNTRAQAVAVNPGESGHTSARWNVTVTSVRVRGSTLVFEEDGPTPKDCGGLIGQE